MPEDQSFKSIVATGELHAIEPLTTHWMFVWGTLEPYVCFKKLPDILLYNHPIYNNAICLLYIE